jgi:manganese-transporting P-type ATPase
MLNTLGQHYMSSRKSIVSAKELSKEIQGNVQDSSEQLFWTLRPGGETRNGTVSTQDWIQVTASKLLPGDVFYLPSKDIMMPVDAMLLEGVCLSQEAAITGESVPQMKVAIEKSDDGGEVLSVDSKHRKSILFAGTKILKCEGLEESSVKCLVLKSGAYSSKGEIVRAITKNSSHIGRISSVEMDRDSLRLIFSLSIFSIMACVYVCAPSNDITSQTSVFRRIIQCTRILIASIPSDLPLALSGVMQSCVTQLKKESDVVCAEPGSLLSAAHVDLCVFDKTGTLTADTQVMNEVKSPFVSNNDCMIDAVLAGCHSLSSLDDGSNCGPHLIGDPLDQAALQFSRFDFNGTDKSASCSNHREKYEDGTISVPVKLWQIKTFPFDANTRRSSALLLVQHSDAKMRLWKVCKGSPDSMKPLLSTKDNMTKDVMLLRYDEFYEALGSRGIRAITLASQDVSSTSIVSKLFPKGLNALQFTKSEKSLCRKIRQARIVAQEEFHMHDFENRLTDRMDFLGFGCFTASMRPSSPRVIKELRDSGTKVLMLTGDGVSAALAIARKANFFDRTCKVFATLDVNKDGTMCWTTVRGKSLSKKVISEFNFQETESVILRAESSHCAMLISGAAIEELMISDRVESEVKDLILRKLDNFSIVASASPQTKQLVMATLKTYCDSYVLMCGDGINDISAMKTADISVALLNGYGKESISKVDEENERRILALKRRSDLKGDFDNQQRVKRKLEEAMKTGSSQSSILALARVLKEEFSRSRALQKGGAEAARILREEALRQSLVDRSTLKNEDIGDIEAIKPGEASLAASFTLLRPSIDGVDAIVRKGVVAAAFSISTFRSIALNSLMACYNLACLYKDGFRYGKYMWNVELAFILAMEKGLGDLSSASRPRIPLLRPERSLFHPSIVLSVFLQAIIHLYVLTQGTRAAKAFQRNCEIGSLGISLRCGVSSLLSRYNKALTNISAEEGGSFLGRRPFQPNLVTNAVLILSIFQNAIISIFNHAGEPFVGSLLESRTFCLWSSASIFFSIAMVLEVQPSLNKVLQLAPMSSKPFKLLLLSLMLFDGLACYMVENLTKRLLNDELWKESRKPAEIKQNSNLAADLEEEELLKLRRSNATLVKTLVVVTSLFALRTTLKDDIFGCLTK